MCNKDGGREREDEYGLKSISFMTFIEQYQRGRGAAVGIGMWLNGNQQQRSVTTTTGRVQCEKR